MEVVEVDLDNSSLEHVLQVMYGGVNCDGKSEEDEAERNRMFYSVS